MSLIDLTKFHDAKTLETLSDEEFDRLSAHALAMTGDDKKNNQILYYRPASEEAEKVHLSKAGIICAAGGNRSSKTESCIVEIVALATGVFPVCLHDVFMEKFRGPLNVRIIMESLTTSLHPIILPKLQYFKWTGIDRPGGERGHWGWIPKTCLIDGEWDRSWREGLRQLRFLCRDPENPDRVLGESQLQMMSKDQDSEDFASGTFHIILHDEPPTYPIWKESRARVLDVGGRLLIAMTWPDDPAIAVDWIYDEVYEKGVPGPNKDPNIDWLELHTVDNIHLDQEVVAKQTASWSDETKRVRMLGQPIRFSNRIHPLYTDTPHHWCFHCGRTIIPAEGKCSGCSAEDFAEYCHVRDFEVVPAFPVIWLLDPHPRKPHMFLWAQIDGNDDIWIVCEGEVDGDPGEVRNYVDDVEGNLSLKIELRLMDPNMGRSPSSAKFRELNWQDEFAEAGLSCDLADDSSVGRSRVNEFLKPDEFTKKPRLHIHSRCLGANSQMKRYAWGEFKQSLDKDVKQTPRDKYDDYPTLLKYLLNWAPTFNTLSGGRQVIKRPGRKSGY
ncbi:MAG TPA: hypothetical protein ENH84_07630 [Phycisphaerae bacterium]|nr:hypothetical protein [Phycisphaerae bacterium]